MINMRLMLGIHIFLRKLPPILMILLLVPGVGATERNGDNHTSGGARTLVILAKLDVDAITNRDLDIYKSVASLAFGLKDPGLAECLTDYILSLEAEALGIVKSESGGSAQQKKIHPETKLMQVILSDLKVWDVNEKEVDLWWARRSLAQQMLENKLKTSSFEPTDEQVTAYYNSRKSKFGNLPEENFKKGIRETLRNQAKDEIIRDWFEGLRRKYKVVNEIPPISELKNKISK